MALKLPNPAGNVPRYDANSAMTVIAGDIKTGKTTFAASAGPSMLILDFERGARLIDGCQSIEVESLGHLKKILELLEEGEHEYKTVAVDSVTALITTIETWAVESFKETRRAGSPPLYTLADVEYGQGYKRAAVQLSNIINRFHGLQRKGIGTLLICHTEQQRTVARNGDEEVKEVPNLSKHYQYPVLGRADAVLHIRREVERDNSIRRVIYTRPDLFSGAIGCRFHGLPGELMPHWSEYAKAVKAGAAELREKRKAAKQAATKKSGKAKTKDTPKVAEDKVGPLPDQIGTTTPTPENNNE